MIELGEHRQVIRLATLITLLVGLAILAAQQATGALSPSQLAAELLTAKYSQLPRGVSATRVTSKPQTGHITLVTVSLSFPSGQHKSGEVDYYVCRSASDAADLFNGLAQPSPSGTSTGSGFRWRVAPRRRPPNPFPTPMLLGAVTQKLSGGAAVARGTALAVVEGPVLVYISTERNYLKSEIKLEAADDRANVALIQSAAAHLAAVEARKPT